MGTASALSPAMLTGRKRVNLLGEDQGCSLPTLTILRHSNAPPAE